MPCASNALDERCEQGGALRSRRILRCCPFRTDYKACAAPKPSVLLDGEEGAMEWVACVGMDWGDKQHAYAIRAREGTKSAGSMGSSAAEVHEWVRALREQFPTGMIVIALEQGRGSLMYALMMYEFIALVAINPRASHAYRESLRLSRASNDPVDAALICEFAWKHLSELHVWQPDDALTRKMRLLAESRRTLVDQRTRFTHTLASTLKQ